MGAPHGSDLEDLTHSVKFPHSIESFEPFSVFSCKQPICDKIQTQLDENHISGHVSDCVLACRHPGLEGPGSHLQDLLTRIQLLVQQVWVWLRICILNKLPVLLPLPGPHVGKGSSGKF